MVETEFDRELDFIKQDRLLKKLLTKPVNVNHTEIFLSVLDKCFLDKPGQSFPTVVS